MENMGLQTLCLAFVYFLTVVCAALAEDCQRECGGISVPYPFGFGSQNCYEKGFDVICNDTAQPQELLLGEGIPLLGISVEKGTVDVEIEIPYNCYDETGVSDGFKQGVTLSETYTFSTTNKFIGIGCDTVAHFSGGSYENEKEEFSSSCASVCDSDTIKTETVDVTTCSNVGCCQTDVPRNLQIYNISLTSSNNHEGQLTSNPCSYAFVADPAWLQNSQNFSLMDYPDKHPRSQLKIDWAVPGKCDQRNETICGPNAICGTSTNGRGYLCSCRKGFHGNPYTVEGCSATTVNDNAGCRITTVAINVAIALLATLIYIFC